MGWELVGNVRGPAWSSIVDVSAMTTAAEINDAAAAAGPGARIWFGNKNFPLVIEDTLIFQPRQRWEGNGGRSLLTRIQAGPGFTAGKPLLAARGYMTNGTVADDPVHVSGITLDCNEKVNSHGLVPYNFWSTFEDIQVLNVSGPEAHGVHISDRSVDGTNVATNSFSENRYIGFRVDKTRGRAKAFFQESNNQASNQDGHLTDSFFAGVDGDCIQLDRAAGWTIENNHLYGIGGHGIRGRGGYGTKIQNNYIEDFGNNNDGYHCAISLVQLDTRGSVISGNTISFRPPFNLEDDALLTPAAQRWTGIYVQAGWDQTAARAVIGDNCIVWAASERNAGYMDKCWAIDVDNENNAGQATPAVLDVAFGNNQIDSRNWFGKRWNVHPRVTMNPDYRKGSVTVGGGSTITLNCELYVQNVTWNPASSGLTINTPSNGRVDGDTFTLTIPAGTTARTVTLASGMDRLTGIGASYDIPANKKFRCLLRFSVADSKWTVDAAAVTQ